MSASEGFDFAMLGLVALVSILHRREFKKLATITEDAVRLIRTLTEAKRCADDVRAIKLPGDTP